jgi:hypothetical protein
LKKWQNIKPNGWKTVPDCPNIQKEFNSKTKIDNVEYSKELLLEFYDPGNLSHLPVIQGYYHSVSSFESYMKWFLKEFSIPDKIGIGTCCKASSKRIVEDTLKLARRYFPKTWIHVFGLKLNHISNVYSIINSWDSMSWTFPRGRGRGSAKTKAERVQYFCEYIESLNKYI